MFRGIDTTMAALREVRPEIQESITEGKPALDAGIVNFPQQRPFLANTEGLMRELRPGVRALRTAAPVLSDALATGIRVLPKTPPLNRRLESLLEELQRFVNGEPIVARPVGRCVRLWRWAKRFPLTAGFAATVLLSLAFMIFASVFVARSLREARVGSVQDVRGAGLMVGIQLRDQSDSPSNTLRMLSRQEYLGYAAAAYLLNVQRVRVLPTLSSPLTLRVQPSAYVSEAHMDRAADALEALCTTIRAADLVHFTGFAVGRPAAPVQPPAPPVKPA
jgi:hypothetical protein